MKFIILLFTILFIAFPAYAQEGGEKSSISDAEISELLTTLEDPQKRDEFIQNLKALNQAKEKQEAETDAFPAISETLNIDEGTSKLISAYDDFLERTGLQGSTIGKITLTILSLIAGLALFFIIRKVGVVLRNRTILIQQKLGLQHSRLRLYSRFFRYFSYLFVTLMLFYTINIIWDALDMSFFVGDSFAAIIGQITSVVFVVFLAVAVWEIINAVLDNIVHRAGYKESMRLQTVMPIVRNIIFVAFIIMFALILLSEFGINVLPLLAGAGVLGIAIGFGAQTMVKDFLTGFTIILEDLIQVGDVAKLAGKTGLIEKITIRKVQMRDLDGIVYTIPFSDVGIIENWTKDYSYYPLDVGVAYREDTDEVVDLLKAVDEDLRQDEKFQHLILEPIEILGVDSFADSAVIIKARIKTKPIKQWEVGREFNRRMKYKFDEHGIEIPFPHQTLYFGVDKKGEAPPAPVKLENK